MPANSTISERVFGDKHAGNACYANQSYKSGRNLFSSTRNPAFGGVPSGVNWPFTQQVEVPSMANLTCSVIVKSEHISASHDSRIRTAGSLIGHEEAKVVRDLWIARGALYSWRRHSSAAKTWSVVLSTRVEVQDPSHTYRDQCFGVGGWSLVYETAKLSADTTIRSFGAG